MKNFSLYSKGNSIVEINEDVNEGVYCLAGANGLGKTTFLNIINYGLTGLVLKPNKEVFSPKEIVKYNKDYTTRYFEGRIKAKDRKSTEVELHFSINNIQFRIIRGFDNKEELKLFEAYKIEAKKKYSLINTQDLSPLELNNEYKKILTAEVGIGKFEYFIFLQLYILTFDENRRMLFWDERALTSALSIAFNYDLSDTERTIELKRKMEKLESDGRNARWQATQIKKKIKSIMKKKEEKNKNNWDKLKKIYDEIYLNLHEKERAYEHIEIEYDVLLKRQNIVNSEILQLKIKYKKLFTQYSKPRSKLLNNQYVIYSKKEHKCFLCSSSGHYIVQNMDQNLHQNNCPVCSTPINEDNATDQDELLNQLEEIDKEIHNKTNELENIIFETGAKRVKLERAEFEFYSEKEKLSEFEKENSNLNFEKTGNLPLDELIKDYKKQFHRFDQESKGFYRERDKLRPEYDNLIEKINSAYIEAEKYFVPLFKKFSKSFIGLNLNIFFNKSGKHISLKFELQGTARSEAFQLSESQRFFLDIALRMALVVYLSKKNNEAALLIDTPEGSLDIAYESRVGKMFAEFVVDHNQSIIMTANINASQLLVSLSNKCRTQKMKFRRMLDWTDLTEIQKEGEHLFELVYKNIQLSLEGKIND